MRPGSLAVMPTDVERVLAIALAKKKTDRFATALELSLALNQALANKLSPPWRAAADALTRQLPWRELVSEQTRELVPVRRLDR